MTVQRVVVVDVHRRRSLLALVIVASLATALLGPVGLIAVVLLYLARHLLWELAQGLIEGGRW